MDDIESFEVVLDDQLRPPYDDNPYYLSELTESRLRLYFYYSVLNSLQELTDNAREIIKHIFN